MTVSTTDRIAGPFDGNDVATSFPFTNFKVLDEDLFEVYHVDAAGAETLLTVSTDYTLVINADQDNNPGGTITYPVSGSPLPTGEKLFGQRVTEDLQNVKLKNQGAWLPTVIEGALDRSVLLVQELKEAVGRAVKVSVSSGIDPDALIDSIEQSESNAAASAAAAAASYDSFDDRYLGAKASDPTLDNDGDALLDGALYWNTTANEMRVYDLGNTTWVVAYLPGAAYLLLAGGTMTGSLVLAGDPTARLEAATKQFVENYLANTVPALTVDGWDFNQTKFEDHIRINYDLTPRYIFTTQTGTPEDHDFAYNGKRFFILSSTGTLFAYIMREAFDVTTAVYESKSFSFTTQNTTVECVKFSKDGTKAYMLGSTGNDTIYQYTLTTPWDLSTISYATKSLDINAIVTGATSMCFDSTGTKLYVVAGGAGSDTIYQFTLSTAWDIETGSYDSKSLYVGGVDPLPSGMAISEDGLTLVQCGSNQIRTWTLSTAFDISTATVNLASFFDAVEYGGTSRGLTMSPDGKTVYYSGDTTNAIAQLNLKNAYDTRYVLYKGKGLSVESFSANNNPFCVSADGTRLYTWGGTNEIFEFILSIPYDIHTAVHTGNSISTATEEVGVTSVQVSPDNQHLYIVGTTNDTVYQYTMTTPGDLSTASYASKSMSVGTQAANPVDMKFSRDGLQCYILDLTTDTVYQYTLTTAWDISTGSYATKNLSVTLQDASPRTIEFNRTGTRMYYLGAVSNNIFQYVIATPWDVSTGGSPSSLLSIGSGAEFESDIAQLSVSHKGAYLYAAGGDKKQITQLPINTAVLI